MHDGSRSADVTDAELRARRVTGHPVRLQHRRHHQDHHEHVHVHAAAHDQDRRQSSLSVGGAAEGLFLFASAVL